jgi:hypothetical protein
MGFSTASRTTAALLLFTNFTYADKHNASHI